jgi:RNA polymerase sigma factor (sigma-70 family)
VELLMTRRDPFGASDDEIVVVPVKAGDRPRLVDIERVYADHYRDVHRYLVGLTASTADAEDVAAETFERAIRTWERVPEPALPWLLLTARRIATDRWRRARRLARLVLAPRRPADGAGEAETEFRLWFRAVSGALTARQREALVLRYQRDLTDADIARIMGLSESGVRSLVARALEILRDHPELIR